MKFFPTIKYVDKISDDVLGEFLTSQTRHGSVFDGLCTLYTEDKSIIIHVVRGKHSTYILFHELCHWLIYRITKQNSYLRKKLHAWVDKFIA